MDANKFDLYVPADNTKESYGLVVYLHAGGFTAGDKSGDEQILKWLCSKGYVAAGINYTLRDEAHTEASVYSQSIEIKESMPVVIAESEKLGYHIDEMSIGGGSAGHCLAMLYAYRDAELSPVPVRMVFGAVGPSSFYPEDWGCYGLMAALAYLKKDMEILHHEDMESEVMRVAARNGFIDMTGSLLPGIDGFSTRMNVGIVSLMRQCTAYAVRYSHKSDHWFGPVLAKHFFD